MSKRWMVICLSLLLIAGLTGVAYAIPEYAPASSGNSELIIVFGAPSEFDSSAGVSAPAPAPQGSQEPVGSSDTQAPTCPPVVPEPSTLVLLGLGLLGIVGLTRRK